MSPKCPMFKWSRNPCPCEPTNVQVIPVFKWSKSQCPSDPGAIYIHVSVWCFCTHTECLYFSTGFLSTISGRWIGTTWTRPQTPKIVSSWGARNMIDMGMRLEMVGIEWLEMFGDIWGCFMEIAWNCSIPFFPGLHCLHILFLFGTSQVHFFGFWDWFPQTMAAGVWPWFSFIFPFFPFCGLTECFWTMIFWVWGVPNVYPLYPYSSHVMPCIRNN